MNGTTGEKKVEISWLDMHNIIGALQEQKAAGQLEKTKADGLLVEVYNRFIDSYVRVAMHGKAIQTAQEAALSLSSSSLRTKEGIKEETIEYCLREVGNTPKLLRVAVELEIEYGNEASLGITAEKAVAILTSKKEMLDEEEKGDNHDSLCDLNGEGGPYSTILDCTCRYDQRDENRQETLRELTGEIQSLSLIHI